MKKIFSLLVLAVAALTATNAQDYGFPKDDHDHNHENVIFVGGAFTYWNNNDQKATFFQFEPEFGVLFNDTWGAGIMLGYEYNKSRHKESGEDHIERAFSVSPFVRYYYMHRGPFNLYIDGGVGFNYSKEEHETVKGFEVGLRPGACIDLTKGLCLCMHLGFIGYRKDYFSGHHDGIGGHGHGGPAFGQNGFGLRFAPEEVSIGLELEF
ncbi:hypothetical protein HQ45_06955 [Porphyromonas crevioricanis]|uniref:Outer membrane protein beta-barrel domain-containing protein n=2 Tax=Porphyromonas crevioricanis TaxID=393921 RepID=A0A0A2FRV1_9PORP|nr:hypothetical protein [Porphyromonas crevioricanis]KGN89714.1 hypothetical protein HQ45_06955 [Porphyromonas crevioricanis]KGN93748.1 hypothetical protein HQ38_08190 [Porphyromonas crevioricanis]SJZ76965.1 Opacity protein [Porphyromonas crevioricanis]SQH72335.1 Uncharacterised protein [Porphyromonas crevioricanis]GAD04480.1 hypothetical protein PORCRE_165 [Porphyromonas crevioricanis JCM 15906]